jgi:hypothetical protein
MPGCLVAAVGADQLQLVPAGDQILERPVGEALVADEGQPGPQRAGVGGVREQFGSYFAFPDFWGGRAPGHGHPVGGGEQVPEPGVVVLRPGTGQRLGHGQACQFRVGQLFRPARPPLGRGDHVIVDQHIRCRQEGFQVCSHERSWMPSSLFMIKATRRLARFPAIDDARFKESLI